MLGFLFNAHRNPLPAVLAQLLSRGEPARFLKSVRLEGIKGKNDIRLMNWNRGRTDYDHLIMFQSPIVVWSILLRFTK